MTKKEEVGERPGMQGGPEYTHLGDGRDDVVSVKARQAQLPQRMETPLSGGLGASGLRTRRCGHPAHGALLKGQHSEVIYGPQGSSQ